MIRKSAFLLSGLFFSGAACAATDFYWCDSCTDQAKAGTAVIHGAGASKYIFVGDLTGKKLKKYLTYYVSDTPQTNPKCQRDVGHCGHWEAADKSSEITSAQTKNFNDLVSYYYMAPVGWKKARNFQIVNPANPSLALTNQARKEYGVDLVSSGMTISAASGGHYEVVIDYPNPNVNVFDVVVQGPAQNGLLGYANTHWGASTYQDIMSTLATFNIADQSAMPTLEVTYKFTDGSLISLLMDYKSSAYKFKVKPRSAYDAQNNSVPQNLDEVAAGPAGTIEIFNFKGQSNPADYNRLMSLLTMMGLKIPGQGLVIACVRSGSGPSCQAYLNQP